MKTVFKHQSFSQKEVTEMESGVYVGKIVPHKKLKNGKKKLDCFFIEPLSDLPRTMKSVLDTSQDGLFVSDPNQNEGFIRQMGAKEAVEKLHHEMVLFRPLLKDNALSAQVVLTEKDVPKTPFFTPVPMLTEEEEKKMKQGGGFSLTSYPRALDAPEFMVGKTTLYRLMRKEALEKVEEGYRIHYPEEIKTLPFSLENERELVFFQRNLFFISKEKRFQWIDAAFKRGERFEMVAVSRDLVNLETERKKTNLRIPILSEARFMTHLEEHAANQQLLYLKEDLYNLHTSLKTSTLTLLGGMSGTGKTELALLYAKTLGLQQDQNLLVVPVSPSFTEPSDLLGFYHPETHTYMESETGLVSFLKRAHQHPNELHMVLFDEMNLGQVEHYFSDFISLLEMPSENRILTLYHHGEKTESVPLGENLLFVGTANFDETTKRFSDRVLDRSNVIFLEKISFLQAREMEKKKKIELLNVWVSAQDYQAWTKEEDGLSALQREELAVLDALHTILSEVDSQWGVSFRVAKAMGRYVANMPVDVCSREKAFDKQIKQRILTKIRGHKEVLEPLIGQEGTLIRFLEEKEVAFKESLSYVKEKENELMRYGYTL